MEATDVIAGYAAVVATLALGWEIRKARQARRPQVKVVVSRVIWLASPKRTPHKVGLTVRLEVRNHGDGPIQVDRVWLESQDGHGVNRIGGDPADTVPGVVNARAAGFAYIHETKVPDLDPSKPLIGWATLTTGEQFRSKPAVLNSLGHRGRRLLARRG